MSFDPEQTMKRIKEAYQEAAYQSNGEAKPLFEKLSESFSRSMDGVSKAGEGETPSFFKMMQTMGPIMLEQQMIRAKLQRLAERDPQVASLLDGLDKTVQQEFKDLMSSGMNEGMFGQLGGSIFGNLRDKFNKPEDETPPYQPRLPAPPKPPTPKKPPKKDYDL